MSNQAPDFQEILEAIESKSKSEKIVYKKHYDFQLINSREDAEKMFCESRRELTDIIDSDSFFNAQPKKRLEAFWRLLSMLCKLAVSTDSEFIVKTDTELNIASIFLTAPVFVFRSRQMLFLHAACMDASEIYFSLSLDGESNTCMQVDFDFSRDDDKPINILSEMLK